MKAKANLVTSLALSKLVYMMCLWGNTIYNHQHKAQIVQNTAARIVTGMHKFSRTDELIETCGWLNISEQTKYYTLMQFWKTVNWRIPKHLEDKITRETEDKSPLRNQDYC